jgi:hypothetical protein
MVLLLALSSLVFAIHTPETRYSVEQTLIEQRDIYFTQNRFGQGYVKPLGGYGKEGASAGSYGRKGAEEGASTLATNAFIPRGRDPSKISNYYSSARGYQIIDEYVELEPVGIELTSRPQINGTPKGYARVISMKHNQLYLPQATVVLRVRDLVPISPDYIYEAWLVDEDTATSLSLGIFQPSEISRVANIEYKNSIPLDAFESIVVTTEPFPDENPGPGQVVLAGNIKQKIVRTP